MEALQLLGDPCYSREAMSGAMCRAWLYRQGGQLDHRQRQAQALLDVVLKGGCMGDGKLDAVANALHGMRIPLTRSVYLQKQTSQGLVIARAADLTSKDAAWKDAASAVTRATRRAWSSGVQGPKGIRSSASWLVERACCQTFP